jgi:alcohol dehydrogenase
VLPSFDFHQRTRLVFGRGTFEQLGELSKELSGRRVLLVTDSGIRKAGHSDRAQAILKRAGLDLVVFDQVSENPTTEDIERCTAFARPAGVDLIIGLGGGSCVDCAKGANFLLTNGGKMQDYRGIGKAKHPMLPMIAVPTTSGTGSEAQSFAVVADASTHMKMACGDVKAACRVAVLDPDLTVSMPRFVTAASGIDALTHAVESYVTTKRNTVSQMFARQAWGLLVNALPVVLRDPANVNARGRMQLGAFLAGAAIENSMLGATHAAANPLTAQFNMIHGVAVGLMLPHVIRWNSEAAGSFYRDLVIEANWGSDEMAPENAATLLADGFSELLKLADLPVSIQQVTDATPDQKVLERLADEAAQQWTGAFNPRKMDAAGFLQLYRNAL